MSNYGPRVTSPTQTDAEGFTRINVLDLSTVELLIQVIAELKLISMKLDCLQADSDTVDDNNLDTLEIQ